jgi:hypothetical protein
MKKKERKWSFKNAAGSPFELWISFLAIINVIGFITRRDANPVHLLVYPWDAVWAGVYFVAGILIAIGLLRKNSAHFEAGGLVLLLAGILVQIVVFGTLGVASLNGTWGSLVSLASLGAITIWRFSILNKISKNIIKHGEIKE